MEGRNRHPVDRLADVRSEIRRFEAEEEELRAYLLVHPNDREDVEHIAWEGATPQAACRDIGDKRTFFRCVPRQKRIARRRSLCPATSSGFVFTLMCALAGC